MSEVSLYLTRTPAMAWVRGVGFAPRAAALPNRREPYRGTSLIRNRLPLGP